MRIKVIGLIYLISLNSFILVSGVIKDCFFIENNTESVEFVCGNEDIESKNSICYRSFIVSDFVDVNRAKLKQINVGSSCSSPALYIDFYKTFINLRVLNISHRKCEYLTAEALNFKYLEKLNAQNNKLNNISNSVLKNLPNLLEVDFSFNEIKNLSSLDFQWSPKLSIMNFSYNQLSHLDQDTFQNLTELRILDLSANFIEVISLKFNNKMEILRLEKNPIKQLNCNLFSLLMSSISVGISWESVDEIDTSCYGNSMKIHLEEDEVIFGVSCNKFKVRYPKKYMKNVKYFNSSGNRLENTQEIIGLLGSSVETLDLSSNFLGQLSTQIFQKFNNLKYLNLSRTNLSHFGFNIFHHQKKINVLDLSFNELTEVNFTLFSRYFKDLEMLYLEGNNLTEMDSITQSNFPHLRFLAISKNRFSCDYSVKFLHQWQNVELHDNVLNQINIDEMDCFREDFDNEISKPNTHDEWNKTDEKHKIILIKPPEVITENKMDSHLSSLISEVQILKYLLLALLMLLVIYLVGKSKLIRCLRERIVCFSFKAYASSEGSVTYRHNSQNNESCDELHNQLDKDTSETNIIKRYL